MLFLIWFKFTFMNQKSVFFNSEVLLDRFSFSWSVKWDVLDVTDWVSERRCLKHPPQKTSSPSVTQRSDLSETLERREDRRCRLYPAITLGNANRREKNSAEIKRIALKHEWFDVDQRSVIPALFLLRICRLQVSVLLLLDVKQLLLWRKLKQS